jgi:hypothetical protein
MSPEMAKPKSSLSKSLLHTNSSSRQKENRKLGAGSWPLLLNWKNKDNKWYQTKCEDHTISLWRERTGARDSLSLYGALAEFIPRVGPQHSLEEKVGVFQDGATVKRCFSPDLRGGKDQECEGLGRTVSTQQHGSLTRSREQLKPLRDVSVHEA